MPAALPATPFSVALARNVSKLVDETQLVEASLHEDDLNGALMIDRLKDICDQIDEIVEKVSGSERDLGWEAQRDLGPETAKLIEDQMAIAFQELMQIKAEQRKAQAGGHTLH